ncbi:MAG: right-handed parallel beta-helix repeat-containing protein [Candidatus Zixiibacteriota bacterium]|nr:MAG: right-handed parallel beta-helix repeat-containing protein [candidate division Zixibacteria bacterium]
MRNSITLTVVAMVLVMAGTATSATLNIERGSDLQSIIDYAKDGDTLILAAKTFEAAPRLFDDPLCGNCLSPTEPVKASIGFKIKGKSLVILGADRQKTRLVTNAGYGVYFEDSQGSIIRNLTVTGGKRDDDGNATDAGIVVRRSTVWIDQVDVRDNTHRSPDSTVVVGIGGVFGREGAEIRITNCNIVNNKWDGVALYRGAIAYVTDCLIKDGRGAGIGVTWDATCTAYRNEVTGFWKGIGSFGTSVVIARNNLVHENLAWGIIATHESYLEATNNIAYHNGQCGVAPSSVECRGRLINNIIARNGWRDRGDRNICDCVGVHNYGDWAKWVFRNNIVFGNDSGQYQDIWDQTGIDGNLDSDPLFLEDGSFRLQPGSPALNAGDSTIYNRDGSRSHIGLYGGPQARQE